MEIISKYFSEFEPTQSAQLQQLPELYTYWNEKINVISRKDIESLWEKHILHSLAIAAICNFSSGSKIVDIGTGGGFPGIPLAILFPEVAFTLVDSIGKKIKVVNEIAQAIGLNNVQAVHGRAESLPPASFDFGVSRAVAPLSDLWKWAKPLLVKGKNTENMINGLICLKGGDLAQEIADSKLKPHLFHIHEIFNEDSFQEKYIVYVPYK